MTKDGENMANKIEVPLEEWVRQIADRAADRVVNQAIEIHTQACPLKRMGLVGNGKPPIDIRLDRIERVIVLACFILSPMYVMGLGLIVKGIVGYLT